MPKIFLGYTVMHGVGVYSYALAEDGKGLAGHVSSNREWAKHDIGLTSNWHHEAYDAYYPNGYELEWVGCIDDTTHEGWLTALKRNQERTDTSGT